MMLIGSQILQCQFLEPKNGSHLRHSNNSLSFLGTKDRTGPEIKPGGLGFRESLWGLIGFRGIPLGFGGMNGLEFWGLPSNSYLW